MNEQTGNIAFALSNTAADFVASGASIADVMEGLEFATASMLFGTCINQETNKVNLSVLSACLSAFHEDLEKLVEKLVIKAMMEDRYYFKE